MSVKSVSKTQLSLILIALIIVKSYTFGTRLRLDKNFFFWRVDCLLWEVTHLASWSGSHGERELAGKALPAETTRTCVAQSASGLRVCHARVRLRSFRHFATCFTMLDVHWTELLTSNSRAICKLQKLLLATELQYERGSTKWSSRFFDIPFMFVVANAIVTVHEQLANNDRGRGVTSLSKSWMPVLITMRF